MSKPKIAVLIDWYLPGTKAGGPVRSVYSLVHLLKNDFDFYIISSNTDLGETEPYKNIQSDVFSQEDGLNYYYFSAARNNPENMLRLFSALKPDLIYLNSFWSLPFSISIVRLKRGGHLKIPVLLAPRGMLGRGALGLKSFKKQVFLNLTRLLGWYRRIPFHATQEQEKKDILTKFHNARIYIAPNINASPATQNASAKVKNHLRLFYLSRIARVKNLHFAIEALRDVPAEYSVEYHIYGNLEDKDYWNECLRLASQLPKNVSVSYQRELPFNAIQQTIKNYHVLLMPTLNENFGHSIVESLLCGCPVIISDQTPWNDLAEHGAGFALDLHKKQDFTKAVISLAALDQQEFWQKSNNAINYISNKIDLPAIAAQYKTMFNDCIKN